MSPILDVLSQGWAGTLVGVIGILFAIAFYLRSRRRAALAYQFDEVTLIGGRRPAFPEEVEVRFSGNPVPRITASRIFLWNCGNTTLNGLDVVDADPLRVELPGDAQLLKHSLLRATRDVNGWQAGPSSKFANHLLLRFDFLDPGDGVALEVVHTGTTGGLNVSGTVRGMPHGVRNFGRALWFYARRRKGIPFPLNEPRLLLGVIVGLGVSTMLTGLLRPQLAAWLPKVFGPDQPDPGRYQRINWVLAVGGFFYMILPAMMLWSRRRRYPSELEPEAPQGDGHKPEAL